MDNETQTHISWSQYAMWSKCPQWWDYIYRQKIAEREESIHTLFGTAIHTVIQNWLTDTVYSDKSIIYAKSVDLSDTFRSTFIELGKPWVGNGLFTRPEFEEFYQHGLDILTYIQENVTKMFPTHNTELFGIEYKLEYPLGNGTSFIGYIDIVTWDRQFNEYKLWDLKTSSFGWNKWAKKDKLKTDQILLYKKMFSEIEKVPLESIDVEYMILKRILPEHSDWPTHRISKFVPAQGNPSVNKVWKSFSEFVRLAHHPKTGERIVDNVVATPSDSTCKFCPCTEICPYFGQGPKAEKRTPEVVSLFD